MRSSLTKREVDIWKASRLIQAVESGELDLETEYQRDTIWPKEKRSKLIDSMLKDIDIPKIYVAHFTKEKRYECIDGKQRIASIMDFYKDTIPSLSGVFFSKLSMEDKKSFLDYEFTISVINNPKYVDIVELFDRLNIGVALNGGEMIHAMQGDLRNFIFKTVGKNGLFIGKVGIKAYRFSRETALAQIIMNALPFRGAKFNRIRYEDIRAFLLLPDNIRFNKATKAKIAKLTKILKEVENIFGDQAVKLNRKSVIVSAYLFCEFMLSKNRKNDLKKFPEFYIKLLEEMKNQAAILKDYRMPDKKILLDEFQKNLQQASSEGYTIERRNTFLAKAFTHYLKTGKIIGDR